MNIENINRVVKRAKWDKLRLDKNIVSFIISILSIQFLVLFLFVLVYIVGFVFLSTFFEKYFVIFLILCLFCDLIYSVIEYFRFINTEFILESSKYIVTGDIIDIRPSKINIKRGFIFRRLKIIPISDFYYVTVNQTFFGRIFNYGNLVLRDENQTPKLTLYDVSDAMGKVKYIQNMIDNMQTKRPINPLLNSAYKSNNLGAKNKES